MASAPMQHVASGSVSAAEYRSFMKQIYYVVRENPQLQAVSTAYFRGHQRSVVRQFYQHAVSEVDHDQLALNDFETMGGDGKAIPYLNPLPCASAMTGFAYYQIYNLNPVGYLGYLFFLEFLPTQAGGVLSEVLLGAGIPANAMTFIRDHIEIDEAHNRLMKVYAERLLQSESDLASAQYAVMTTGYLYEQLLAAAIADARQPMHTGWNWEELNADGVDPRSLEDHTLTVSA